MATRAGLGRISRNSDVVRFVQGGGVKTIRCSTCMIDKATIIDCVDELKRLALSRNTEQGVLVIDNTLAECETRPPTTMFAKPWGR